MPGDARIDRWSHPWLDLPKLEEGNLWIRATMPATISLDEGNDYINGMRNLICSFPEVETVVSQHGRPDDGTDPAGFFNVEFFAPLKPMAQWRKGLDKDDLTAEILAIGKGIGLTVHGPDLAFHPGIKFLIVVFAAQKVLDVLGVINLFLLIGDFLIGDIDPDLEWMKEAYRLTRKDEALEICLSIFLISFRDVCLQDAILELARESRHARRLR